MKKYRVKIANTGEVVAIGTAFECMKKLGFSSISSFHTIVSRSKSGENRKYIIDVIESRKGVANHGDTKL